MPNPYEQTGMIQGQLPPMGAAGAIGGSPGDIQAGYERAYNSALGQNSANYSNILAGYQQVAAGQRSAQDAIGAGYPQLAGRVQDRLAGSQAAVQGQLAGSQAGVQDRLGGLQQQLGSRGEQTQSDYGSVGQRVQDNLGAMRGALGEQYGREAFVGRGYQDLTNATLGDISMAGQEGQRQIADQYAQGSANVRQGAIGRGLGNTTIQDTMQRGVEMDRARAQANLQEGIGNLRAGYRQSLGNAQLGFNERQMGVDLNQQNLISQSLANAAGQYGTMGLQARQAYDTQAAGVGQQAAGYGAQFGLAGAGYGAQYGLAGAGYEAGIGQAGLGFGERASGNNAALAQNQLGWMNSVSAPYPNAGAYMQAAQMSGAADAARRAQSQGDFGQQPGMGMGGGGGMHMVPGTGRGVPSLGSYGEPAPGFNDMGFSGPAGYTPLAPQQLGAGTRGGVAAQPTIMSTGGMQMTGGYNPTTSIGAYGLTGGSDVRSQPAPAQGGGGYNPRGFGGGYGSFGPPNPADEYGFTEADWQAMYAQQPDAYNWLSDTGEG